MTELYPSPDVLARDLYNWYMLLLLLCGEVGLFLNQVVFTAVFEKKLNANEALGITFILLVLSVLVMRGVNTPAGYKIYILFSVSLIIVFLYFHPLSIEYRVTKAAHRRARRKKHARETLKKLELEINKEHGETGAEGFSEEQNLQTAGSFIATGDLMGAVKEFTKALRHNPENSQTHYLLAQCYEHLGFFEQAEKAYYQALAWSNRLSGEKEEREAFEKLVRSCLRSLEKAAHRKL